jgi:hypothetical protein
MDLKEVEWSDMDWVHVVYGRDKWRGFVNKMNITKTDSVPSPALIFIYCGDKHILGMLFPIKLLHYTESVVFSPCHIYKRQSSSPALLIKLNTTKMCEVVEV